MLLRLDRATILAVVIQLQLEFIDRLLRLHFLLGLLDGAGLVGLTDFQKLYFPAKFDDFFALIEEELLYLIDPLLKPYLHNQKLILR